MFSNDQQALVLTWLQDFFDDQQEDKRGISVSTQWCFVIKNLENQHLKTFPY